MAKNNSNPLAFNLFRLGEKKWGALGRISNPRLLTKPFFSSDLTDPFGCHQKINILNIKRPWKGINPVFLFY